eukprot:CAMPEP_0117577850 /NCGR_PEP_ID=MMETSP0784-20121206/63652_1 /TAXON_ID=39447 /ORGANISM="" /LENGTH=59 /DNA_ID=CAMNT_0005377399 /DNA_START=176 /DNA_END=355 /DNA_ORIENTATION=-
MAWARKSELLSTSLSGLPSSASSFPMICPPTSAFMSLWFAMSCFNTNIALHAIELPAQQ